MRIPSEKKKLQSFLEDLKNDCMISADNRAALCRDLRQWKYTGTATGDAAIYNRLIGHIDRLASYLFSPFDLRFQMDFDIQHNDEILKQGEVAARYITKAVSKRSIDLTFAAGVEGALDYGATIMKMGWGNRGLTSRLIMPWSFGVYREDLNDLDSQEALCEKILLTKEEFWRRISHLPDAQEMFDRACSYAKKQSNLDGADTYFRQILMAGTSPIIETDQPYSTAPGGFVNTGASPTAAMISTDVAESLITFYEITVVDDAQGDYVTLQLAEPDIVVTRLKRSNMFIPLAQPYTLIQANRIEGNIWGRAEIADLMMLQNLLTERMGDIKSIMSKQYDRIRAFIGFSGMNDEQYDQMNEAGWIAQENPGAKVEDLTPELPAHGFEEIKMIIDFMDDVSGFQNILGGTGGSEGVRSNSHAQTLMKTSSPRLRDRAIYIERQCAEMGDKVYNLCQAKNANQFFTDPKNLDSGFLLSQIPDDGIIEVDSHSSSPLYEDDHKEMTAFLLKSQVIDGESALDLLHVPMRDRLKAKWRQAQAQKAQMIKEHPELLTGKKGK